MYILAIIVFLTRFQSMPPQLPLFYSRPEGNAQIADWYAIFIPLIVVAIIVFFNIFFVKVYFKQIDFIKKIVSIANYIFIMICVFIFIKIVLLIT